MCFFDCCVKSMNENEINENKKINENDKWEKELHDIQKQFGIIRQNTNNKLNEITKTKNKYTKRNYK